MSIRRTTVHVSPAKVYNKRFRSFFSLRRPLFLPSQLVHSPSSNPSRKPFLRYLVNLLHLLSSAAMHDSPSSPRRSIAPAPSKQQHAKKAGAPKAKGAVRAKSGCYTCRIRRKVGHLPCLGGPRSQFPVIYMLTLVASPPSRNATNGQMERAVARRVSVSASNALALARSAPIGSRYVCAWLLIVRFLGISPPCFPPFS